MPSKGKPPTPEQIEFLEEREIKVPPKRDAATSLIFFIVGGNSTVGWTVEERVEITKQSQDKWLGKKVRAGEAIGRVDYLIALSALAVEGKKRVFSEQAPRIDSPFRAVVRWENGKTTVVGLNTLVFVDEGGP